MAITSRQIAANHGSTSVTHDGTVAAGEYLLAFVSWEYNTSAAPVSMSGWTLLGSTDGNAFSPFLRVFGRVATGSEPSSYSITASASGLGVILIASSGVDTDNPLTAGPTFSTTGRGSGNAPSITPGSSPSQAIWAVAHQTANNEPTITWSGVDARLSMLATNWLHSSVAAQARTDTSDTGTRGWSISPYSGNTDAVNVGLALREGSSEPPPIQIALRAARAATRATRPTLTTQGVFAVRAARAAARATRPLLVGGPLPVVVQAARATTAATQPIVSVDLRSIPTIRLASPPGDRWAFVLGPASGGYEWEVANARQRRINLKLRGPSTASFSINGEDPIAERIVELSTDLHVLRDRGDGLREVLYRGRVGSVSDQLGETGHDVSVPTVDYRGVLERRHLMSGSQVSWGTPSVGVEQTTIAFGLIQQAQRLSGGDYGITNAAPVTGRTRERNYELGDSIGQRIQELSEVENGFDWDIVPDGPSGLNFTAWHPNRGLNRGVLLDYGGLVSSLTRNVDSSDYANHVRVTGQPPEGSSTPPPPHEGVADGIADPLLFPQGRWDKVIGTSIILTNTLAERRSWLLDHHQVIRPAYTVNLKRGAWRGPDHIWLGDSVRLVIMSGRLKVDETLRVHEIDIALSEAGSEDVTLTLGNPRPNFATRTSAIEKRLEELERR